MNKRLVKFYVAGKLAFCDPKFLAAREKMGREEFVEFMMKQSASSFPPEVLRQCERTVNSRYKLERRARIFRMPTVGQYISDFTSDYTTEDIMDFFQQETGLRKSMLATEKIGGQVIMRPALIWMVEHLEAATGRQLTMAESDAPLAYLGDNVTIKEIAKHFSTTSEVISRLRRRHCHYTSSIIKDALRRFRPMVISSYRRNADIAEDVTEEQFLASRLMDNVPKGFPATDWDLPIIWLEDDLNLQFPSFSGWVDRNTTVSDLVDAALLVKRKQLEGQRF